VTGADVDGQAVELVAFGNAPGNKVRADWQLDLLRRLWKAHPEAFGRQLMELYAEKTLEQPWTVTKKRKRAG
jgi:hypothetical protein